MFPNMPNGFNQIKQKTQEEIQREIQLKQYIAQFNTIPTDRVLAINGKISFSKLHTPFTLNEAIARRANEKNTLGREISPEQSFQTITLVDANAFPVYDITKQAGTPEYEQDKQWSEYAAFLLNEVKTFTSKNDPTTKKFTINRRIFENTTQIPIFQRNPDGSVVQIEMINELANGLSVSLFMNIYETKDESQKNGLNLQYIIIEEPVKWFEYNNAKALSAIGIDPNSIKTYSLHQSNQTQQQNDGFMSIDDTTNEGLPFN